MDRRRPLEAERRFVTDRPAVVLVSGMAAGDTVRIGFDSRHTGVTASACPPVNVI